MIEILRFIWENRTETNWSALGAEDSYQKIMQKIKYKEWRKLIAKGIEAMTDAVKNVDSAYNQDDDKDNGNFKSYEAQFACL